MVFGIGSHSSSPLGLEEAHHEGNRVEFHYRGELKVGTVLSAGDRPLVIVDVTLDEFAVPARYLRSTAVPVPKDPAHPMDEWSVRGYREHRSRSYRSVAFTCAVSLRGVAVLFASNDGSGGSNVYAPGPGIAPDIAERLELAAHGWLVDHGMPSGAICGAADAWLEWKANEAPYGITATAMVEDRLYGNAPTDRESERVAICGMA